MKQTFLKMAVGATLVASLAACPADTVGPDPEPTPPTKAEVDLLVDPNPVHANYEGNGWYRFKVNLAFSEHAGIGFTINSIRTTVSSALSGATLLDANSPVAQSVAAKGTKVLQFTCPQYHMEYGASAAVTRFVVSITDDRGNAISLSGQANVLRHDEPRRLP